MGEAFMPRRGGSLVRHRHKYVARYTWTPTKDENGYVLTATCTRTFTCSCGELTGEETVEATERAISEVEDAAPCQTYTSDYFKATFSDGDVQTKYYNTEVVHTPVDDDGDGRCDICFGVIK